MPFFTHPGLWWLPGRAKMHTYSSICADDRGSGFGVQVSHSRAVSSNSSRTAMADVANYAVILAEADRS